MNRILLCILLLLIQPVANAAGEGNPALQRSVEQLRDSIGLWNVITENLDEDGTVASSMTGTYEFSWIVPDRVVTGRMDIPERKQSAGILFYVNESKSVIEMVSVGADGTLWTMTGALGAEVRTTQEFKTREGGTGQLRFTRFNVGKDQFESRMEYTEDGGKTWKPGNHQVFKRAGSADS